MAERFDAVCAGCGCDTTVPFQPKGGKPVLCTPCYRDERAQEGGGQSRQTPPRTAAASPMENPDVVTTALAVRAIGQTETLALSGTQTAEITWHEVQVEPAMTYNVGRIKMPDGRWVDQVGVLSNVWDFLGQVRGISFGAPRVTENTDERVAVEVGCTYLNPQGRQVTDTEVYEIDCGLMLQISRAKWTPKEGQEVEEEPHYDDAGNLVGYWRRLPRRAEKDLWDNFLTLKRNKLAKAITCAHRRLCQRAIGTKTLTPESLTLMFPVIRQHFSGAQIQDAVASVYGDEDEVMGHQAAAPADVVDGEVVEPAPAPAAQPASAEAASEGPDEATLRKGIYREFWPLAKRGGDTTNAAVRARLAEWGCCADDDGGQPSLRASSLDQIRDAIRRYETLLQEQEDALERAPF